MVTLASIQAMPGSAPTTTQEVGRYSEPRQRTYSWLITTWPSRGPSTGVVSWFRYYPSCINSFHHQLLLFAGDALIEYISCIRMLLRWRQQHHGVPASTVAWSTPGCTPLGVLEVCWFCYPSPTCHLYQPGPFINHSSQEMGQQLPGDTRGISPSTTIHEVSWLSYPFLYQPFHQVLLAGATMAGGPSVATPVAPSIRWILQLNVRTIFWLYRNHHWHTLQLGNSRSS